MVKVKQAPTFITGVGCGSGRLWGRLLGNLGIAKHQGLHTFLQLITQNVKHDISVISVPTLGLFVFFCEEKNVRQLFELAAAVTLLCSVVYLPSDTEQLLLVINFFAHNIYARLKLLL